MSTGLNHAAHLVTKAREARGISKLEFSEQAGISRTTITQFEQQKITPFAGTLEKIEAYFGWPQGFLTDIIQSDDPESIADISELTGTLPEAQLSDDALLWELTHRMQSKDALIEQLQDKVTTLEAEVRRLRGH